MPREFRIPVRCLATVTVRLPDPQPLLGDDPLPISDEDARLLAEKLALARILATVDSPDAPEDKAFEEYTAECSEEAREHADLDWDSARVIDVGANWSLTSTFAEVAWSVGDLTERYAVTDEEAEEFLLNNQRQISEDMVGRGWESIDVLASMSGIKRQGGA